MAAKGTEAKEVIFNKILETFEGAFMADAKTLRIPYVENGETIEIKVALTAAKDILGGGVKEESLGEAIKVNMSAAMPTAIYEEPSEEEKERLKKLLETL